MNKSVSAVLGGATSTLTPGKIAKSAKAKSPSKSKKLRADGTPKRAYTPRNATYHARRIVLLDGEPVGKGRPAKDGKSKRMVVYVPVGMDYNVKLHGPGVKFNTASHAAPYRRIAKDSVSYTFADGKVGKVKAAKSTAKRKAPQKAKVVAVSVDTESATLPSVEVDATVATPVNSTEAVAA